jgi:hypothetical protein
MRISYTCPEHLKFSLNVESWTGLVTMTRESIEWLGANEEVYDTWMVVSYAATSCALVQVTVHPLDFFRALLRITRSITLGQDGRTSNVCKH